ncbi:MAG: methionyl-tRNA formyltransferase, partial [Ginsengibacter sp.]
INDKQNVRILRELQPDIFFAVGLSQLISNEMLSIAKLGNIGFHPTLLPKGRGRAPIAWLILRETYGASNFFLMGEGTDDGPIFVQHPFNITNDDDALTVEGKIISTLNSALDEWLPQLKKGVWLAVPQDGSKTTEYGKRTPIDGVINWYDSAVEIDKLIRASTKPHPGAFTFYGNFKLTMWSSKLENKSMIEGVVGRVLKIDAANGLMVQTGHGLLWIDRYECFDYSGKLVHLKIQVGSRFGYYEQYEIYKLRNEIDILKNKIDELTKD